MNVHLSYLEEENEELYKTINALNKFIKEVIFKLDGEYYDPCEYCDWFEELEVIDSWGSMGGPCGCCDKYYGCWRINERKVIDYELCKE